MLYVGEEVYSLEATEWRILEDFVVPKGAEGLYSIVVSYEFPQGEIEYGFKVKRSR